MAKAMLLEVKLYGLWRITLLERVIRFVPTWWALRRRIAMLVVRTTGVKTRPAGRKWKRACLFFTTESGRTWGTR